LFCESPAGEFVLVEGPVEAPEADWFVLVVFIVLKYQFVFLANQLPRSARLRSLSVLLVPLSQTGVVAKILLSWEGVIPVADHNPSFVLADIIMLIAKNEISLAIHLPVNPVPVKARASRKVDFSVAVRDVLDGIAPEIALFKGFGDGRVFYRLGLG